LPFVSFIVLRKAIHQIAAKRTFAGTRFPLNRQKATVARRLIHRLPHIPNIRAYPHILGALQLIERVTKQTERLARRGLERLLGQQHRIVLLGHNIHTGLGNRLQNRRIRLIKRASNRGIVNTRG
jgi:hypothetical protein